MAFNDIFLALKVCHSALYADIQGIVGMSPLTLNIVKQCKLVINFTASFIPGDNYS
jgi:hypothetical protein